MDRKESFHKRHPVWAMILTLTAVSVALGVVGAIGGSDQPSATTGQTAASTTATVAATATRPASTATRPSAPPRASSTKTQSAATHAGPAPRRRATIGGSAASALAALPVRGRAPMTGYSREQFGDGWLTVDGCDTRDRILQRDLSRKTFAGGDTCRVQSGHLNDPYTAAAITFVRGGASEVDIDHVVALGDAWQKGAQQWSAARRAGFANDPLNLLSVDAGANRQKGDGDAATWLPASRAFRCRYAARQIAVKRKYHAWVTRAEHEAMARVLATCPRQRLPAGGGGVRVPLVPTHTAPAQRGAPKAAPAPSGHGRVFAKCDAVRAAGLAPLRQGSADYAANPKLDRDRDGVACE